VPRRETRRGTLRDMGGECRWCCNLASKSSLIMSTTPAGDSARPRFIQHSERLSLSDHDCWTP
jgi:hypothetical protein